MNYVNEQNMQEILDGIARKIGQGGSSDSSGVVAEQEVLYEGTELITDMTLNTIYQISDITGYDFLILTIEAPISDGTNYTYIQTEVLKGTLVDTTTEKYRYDFNYSSQGYTNNPQSSFAGNYSFPDSTHIRFAPRLFGTDYTGVRLKKIEGIKFVSSSSSTPENNYSTEEHVIGTWIDGKPLYQKTYSGTIPSGADSANANIFIDTSIIGSLDTGFISEGYILNNGDYLAINENNESEKSSRIWISTSQNSIRGRVGNLLIGSTISVTIKYTKTTDGGGGT